MSSIVLRFVSSGNASKLPARPALKDGESLTGWLDRLAASNGMQKMEFYSLLGVSQRFLNMREGLSREFVFHLSRLSGGTEGAIIASYRPFAIAMTHEPIGLFNAMDAACWSCLDQYGIEKCMWRFNYEVVCIEHAKYLARRRLCKDKTMHIMKSSGDLSADFTCFASGYKARDSAGTVSSGIAEAQTFFAKAFEIGEALVGTRMVRARDLFSCLDLVRKTHYGISNLSQYLEGRYPRSLLRVLYGQSRVRGALIRWQYLLVQYAPRAIRKAILGLHSSDPLGGDLKAMASEGCNRIVRELDCEAAAAGGRSLLIRPITNGLLARC